MPALDVKCNKSFFKKVRECKETWRRTPEMRAKTTVIYPLAREHQEQASTTQTTRVKWRTITAELNQSSHFPQPQASCHPQLEGLFFSSLFCYSLWCVDVQVWETLWIQPCHRPRDTPPQHFHTLFWLLCAVLQSGSQRIPASAFLHFRSHLPSPPLSKWCSSLPRIPAPDSPGVG